MKDYYPDNIFETFMASPQDDRLVINAERIVYRDNYMSTAIDLNYGDSPFNMLVMRLAHWNTVDDLGDIMLYSISAKGNKVRIFGINL